MSVRGTRFQTDPSAINQQLSQKIAAYKSSRNEPQSEIIRKFSIWLLDQKIDGTLSQSELSKWLRGKELNTDRQKRVYDALLTFLELDPGVLDRVPEAKLPAAQPYVADVKAWVRTAVTDNSRKDAAPCFYLFPRNYLPAFNNAESFAHLWAANCLQGVNYRIFWVLEEISELQIFSTLDAHLQLVRTLMSEPGECLQAGEIPARVKGCIEIFLIRREDKMAVDPGTTPYVIETNFQSFHDFALRDSPTTEPKVIWREIPAAPKQAKPILAILESISSTVLSGRLTVLMPGASTAARTQVSVVLPEVSVRLQPEKETIFLWFGEQIAARLAEKISQLNKLIPQQESDD